MGDDFLEGDDEVVGGDEGSQDSGGGKKVGFLPAIVIQILKWAAIIVGAVIFIVTVVVVTINIMGVNNPGQTRVERSEEYTTVLPTLSWYSEIPQLRGKTAGENGGTFVIEIHLGYPEEDAATNNEIIKKDIQITDILLSWFGSQNQIYLQDIGNRNQVREIIKRQINEIMTRDIEDIRFTKFEVLDF